MHVFFLTKNALEKASLGDTPCDPAALWVEFSRMMKHQKGFSLLEIVVALVVAAVVTIAIVPFVSSYILQARMTTAEADLKTIGDAIIRFEADMGRYPFYTSGSGFLQDSGSTIIRLEGPGLSPTATNASSNWVNGSVADDLVDQLIANTPAYPTTSSLAKPFKWKGPYLTLKADPWGNKYLVNITNAKSSSTFAAFVLSAGPDGVVQTAFDISETSSVAASGDDLIYRIR